MFGSAQPDTSLPPRKDPSSDAALQVPSGAAVTPGNGDHVLDGHELEAALQLLVERAQYITGATGAALALSQGEEMVCKASVGSGPAIGARLQVRSGLTGESIARRQLLRCDNAEADGRVNLETCRQLGIASIVVAPLLARDGEVRGLFELFSDHAYAFEERDLTALERMAGLTLTALELAEKRRMPAGVAAPISSPQAPAPAEANPSVTNPVEKAAAIEGKPAPQPAELQPLPTEAPSVGPLGPALVHSALQEEPPAGATPGAVPEAMRRVQKCASCGFPVSEGRTLCLDCENKRDRQPDTGESVPAEFVPAFLADSPPPDESWLANHVNLLAVLVLVLSIIVAVVVFR
ncbi:MAG TPA: GAF domain-containing protein [Terriglobales bacterium]|nr:GAF domain-containing protein [Terriglobales bacterium]